MAQTGAKFDDFFFVNNEANIDSKIEGWGQTFW